MKLEEMRKAFRDAKKKLGLKRTVFRLSHLAPEYGWVGISVTKGKKVIAVVDPIISKIEIIYHECVHAFFRELEIERGIPSTELTFEPIEEITALIVSKALVKKRLKLCSDIERAMVEDAIDDDISSRKFPEMTKEARILNALSVGCICVEDSEFIKKVWGKNPINVYNKVAQELGYKDYIARKDE